MITSKRSLIKSSWLGCGNPECEKRQILIIDDNNFNIMALEMQIELIIPDNFELTQVLSGAKGLEALKLK